MPWKDWFGEKALSKKWRSKREAERQKSLSNKEAQKQKVLAKRQRELDEHHEACESLAYLLWEADGKPENRDDEYFLKAEKQLSGVRWYLYKLNQPFASKVIEPFDRWSNRANLFNLLPKLSYVFQAIGLLLIPFVLLRLENRRVVQQHEFEQNLIEIQSQVRRQEAVRDYLAQMTSIFMDSGKSIREQDEDVIKLVEATTLAVFNTLSVNERVELPDQKKEEIERKEIERKEIGTNLFKGQVVEFLADLGWINGSRDGKSLMSLAGANLRDASLEGANLTYAKLEGVDFESANLNGAKLNGAKLNNAILKHTNLRNAKLNGTSFNSVKLYYVDLENAELKSSNFDSAILERANLENVELNGASFNSVRLDFVDLENANLENADLENSRLSLVDLNDAKLSGAKLNGSYLYIVDLKDADLDGASLENTDLESANLQGANLTSANLNGANLEYTNLSGANLEFANLNDVNFEKVIFCKTTMPDGGINNQSCSEVWKWWFIFILQILINQSFR